YHSIETARGRNRNHNVIELERKSPCNHNILELERQSPCNHNILQLKRKSPCNHNILQLERKSPCNHNILEVFTKCWQHISPICTRTLAPRCRHRKWKLTDMLAVVLHGEKLETYLFVGILDNALRHRRYGRGSPGVPTRNNV
ncbi:hypothetical protein LSAT2_012116, partial [Lamellibrachia satsuma]